MIWMQNWKPCMSSPKGLVLEFDKGSFLVESISSFAPLW